MTTNAVSELVPWLETRTAASPGGARTLVRLVQLLCARGRPPPSMAAARQIPEANVEADPQANRPRNDASQSLATPLGFAANWFIQCVFAGVALPDRSMARAIS